MQPKNKAVTKAKPNVEQVLLDELRHIQASDKSVAVLLSGGVDSNSVLFACLELGLKTHAYSFCFKDAPSRDFKYAQAACEKLGVPFHPVYLNRSVDHLLKYMDFAVKIGCRSKTDFECFWPMYMAMRKIEQDGHGWALSATAADSHFALSKKANMHFKDKVGEYQLLVFKKRNTGQKILLRTAATILGIQYLTPYDTTRMVSELHGYTWDELNKPRQKQPIRDAFKSYFDKVKTANHTNLQLGDSGIAEHFKILLDTKLNPGKRYKAVKGVYNEVCRIHAKENGEVLSDDEDEDE